MENISKEIRNRTISQLKDRLIKKEEKLTLSVEEKSRIVESLIFGLQFQIPIFKSDKDNVWTFLEDNTDLHVCMSFQNGDFVLSGLKGIPSLNGMTYNDLPGRFFNELEKFEFKVIIFNPDTDEKNINYLIESKNIRNFK